LQIRLDLLFAMDILPNDFLCLGRSKMDPDATTENFRRTIEPQSFVCSDLLYRSNKISVADSDDAEPGISELRMFLKRVVAIPALAYKAPRENLRAYA
jgi:hypothetical protein